MTENNAAQPGLTDDEILDAIKAGVRAARDEGLACAGPDNYVQAGALALLSKLRAEGVQAGDERAHHRNDGFSSLSLWWTMIEAEAELIGEPIKDDRPILSFMGSGASHQVTAGDIRAALASAPVAGEAQHPDDIAVDNFAAAMKAKLAKKRAEGRYGWQSTSHITLSALLYEHMYKGDPLDVGNLSMMLHQNGKPIELPEHARRKDAAPQASEALRPCIPPAKPLPDLMMASYHEAIGWNACRDAMLATIASPPVVVGSAGQEFIDAVDALLASEARETWSPAYKQKLTTADRMRIAETYRRTRAALKTQADKDGAQPPANRPESRASIESKGGALDGGDCAKGAGKWPMLSELHLHALMFAYNEGYSKAYDGRVFPNPFSENGSQAAAWQLGTDDGTEARAAQHPRTDGGGRE